MNIKFPIGLVVHSACGARPLANSQQYEIGDDAGGQCVSTLPPSLPVVCVDQRAIPLRGGAFLYELLTRGAKVRSHLEDDFEESCSRNPTSVYMLQ